MPKTIDTLVEDIHNVFQLPHEFNEERMERFSKRMVHSVSRKINPPDHSPSLRMSNLGKRCNRALWYHINKAGSAEAIEVSRRVKFLYGDILEELLLFLAEEAGHTVSGTQDELSIDGIVGHRDAVIDGVLVDVKSASTYSFKKFKEGLTYADDEFGYLTQIQSYLYASQSDPLVTEKDRCAFLVIDKTLGHITLDIHPRDETFDPKTLISVKKKTVALPEPPERHYQDEEIGKSGNRGLCTACSYCDFKRTCWPNLRTFIYSNGPEFLTHVERTPNVPEVEKLF